MVDSVERPLPKQSATQAPIAVTQQPVTPAKIEPPTQLTGPASLKDPQNILSKRIIYFDYDSNLVKEEFRPLVAAHAKYLSHRLTCHEKPANPFRSAPDHELGVLAVRQGEDHALFCNGANSANARQCGTINSVGLGVTEQ